MFSLILNADSSDKVAEYDFRILEKSTQRNTLACRGKHSYRWSTNCHHFGSTTDQQTPRASLNF